MHNAPLADVNETPDANLRTFRYRRYFDAVVAGIPKSQVLRVDLLGEYRYSVDDHIETAIESMGRIKLLRVELSERHKAVVELGDSGLYRVLLDDEERARTVYRQIERELRIFVNEARAVLESLSYEVATALCPLPTNASGVEEEHKNLGIAAKAFLALFETPRATRLRDYIVRVVGDSKAGIPPSPEYDRLHQMRNISFHRRIIGPVPAVTWAKQANARLNVDFLVPDDPKAVPFTHQQNRTLDSFLVRTMHWLRHVSDEVYRLASIAHRGFAQPTRRGDYARRWRRPPYRGRSFIKTDASLAVGWRALDANDLSGSSGQ